MQQTAARAAYVAERDEGRPQKNGVPIDARCGVCPLLALDLHNNRVGNAGAAQIADALKYNRTLKSLQLQENEITESGAFDLQVRCASFFG